MGDRHSRILDLHRAPSWHGARADHDHREDHVPPPRPPPRRQPRPRCSRIRSAQATRECVRNARQAHDCHGAPGLCSSAFQTAYAACFEGSTGMKCATKCLTNESKCFGSVPSTRSKCLKTCRTNRKADTKACRQIPGRRPHLGRGRSGLPGHEGHHLQQLQVPVLEARAEDGLRDQLHLLHRGLPEPVVRSAGFERPDLGRVRLTSRTRPGPTDTVPDTDERHRHRPDVTEPGPGVRLRSARGPARLRRHVRDAPGEPDVRHGSTQVGCAGRRDGCGVAPPSGGSGLGAASQRADARRLLDRWQCRHDRTGGAPVLGPTSRGRAPDAGTTMPFASISSRPAANPVVSDVFAATENGGGPATLTRDTQTILDVRGRYQAALRDATGAQVGWMRLRIGPYQAAARILRSQSCPRA